MLNLKRVGDSTYVNIGGGNITSVSSENAWGSRINFVGGSYVAVAEPLSTVVTNLLAEED